MMRRQCTNLLETMLVASLQRRSDPVARGGPPTASPGSAIRPCLIDATRFCRRSRGPEIMPMRAPTGGSDRLGTAIWEGPVRCRGVTAGTGRRRPLMPKMPFPAGFPRSPSTGLESSPLRHCIRQPTGTQKRAIGFPQSARPRTPLAMRAALILAVLCAAFALVVAVPAWVPPRGVLFRGPLTHAPPPSNRGERVVFARSCSECDPGAYWYAARPPSPPSAEPFPAPASEFARPSAPADHIACVTNPSSRSLLRRYCSGAWTTVTLGTNEGCAGAGDPETLGEASSLADLLDYDYPKTCKEYCDAETLNSPSVVAELRWDSNVGARLPPARAPAVPLTAPRAPPQDQVNCLCSAETTCTITPVSGTFTVLGGYAFVNAGGCN
ncbi:hypothetical protein DFJ74DRAFT_655659 [Hyaloraphidium curvatum]|nr:hypothetical protein DFJ74DRAFT_655659 [Hyaloraphidium curvatum]